jgi:hypothetical protein
MGGWIKNFKTNLPYRMTDYELFEVSQAMQIQWVLQRRVPVTLLRQAREQALAEDGERSIMLTPAMQGFFKSTAIPAYVNPLEMDDPAYEMVSYWRKVE